MALRRSTHFILTLAVNCLSIFSAVTLTVDGHDHNIPANFPWPAPQNSTEADSKFYTYTAGRSLVGAPPPTQFKVFQADGKSFPALGGEGVSMSVLQFPGGVVNPPHSHPQASELLLLLSGALQVGFVNAENKLFNQTLQAGDMFVFPKGLIHYHYNFQPNNPAIAVTAFGSANSGLVSIPANLFTTGVDDAILAQSFKTDIPTVQRLKASLAQNWKRD